MITYIDIHEFISQGEDIVREFKITFKNHLAKIGQIMCAYANDLNWVGGGYIFIGVDNTGKIIGSTEDFDELQKQIADLCRQHISPPIAPFIKKTKVDNKDVFEIKIVRSISRPHRFRNICYIRIGSTTPRATLDEEEQIRQCSIVPSYDHQPVAKSSENDIDLNKFRNYLLSTKSTEIFETESDVTNIATNLEFLIQSGDAKLAKVGTILLFGKSPNKFFPHSKIQVIRFKGRDLAAPIASRQTFEGTTDELIRITRNFIENLSGTASEFPATEENRIDYLEYPHWAIREAMANAVVHRDYAESGREIDIRIFDDKIEIISPGGLGGGLTIKDLGTGKRYIRNQLIADVLNEIKFIEKAGTGILRMRKAMEDNGSPEPIFKSDQNTFIATLPAHPFYVSQRLLEEANHEKSRANYPGAKALYEKALSVNPSNYLALTGNADLEMQLGNRDKARELYKAAIDLQPNNSHAWLSIAILEERHGNINFAREVYKDASKAVKKNSVVYRGWAILEWNERNYKQADSLFEEALRRDQKDHMTWYKRGQMNINSPIEKIKRQGENHLRKAANLTQDTYTLSDIYFLLARAMATLRYNDNEIIDTYRQSLELNPARRSVYYHFGNYLESIGKKDEARKHLQKAKEMGYVPKRKERKY